MKTVSSQSRLVALILFLDLILNILIQLIPSTIKSYIASFVSLIGLTYSTFWFILTSIIVLIILFVSIRKTRIEKTKEQSVDKYAKKRVVNQYGSKSIYIEKNKGDIKIE